MALSYRDEIRERWKSHICVRRNHLSFRWKNLFDSGVQFAEIVAKLRHVRSASACAKRWSILNRRDITSDVNRWNEERKLLFAIRCYFIQLVPSQTVVLVLQASYVNKSRTRANRVPARWFSGSLRAWSFVPRLNYVLRTCVRHNRYHSFFVMHRAPCYHG